MMSYLNKLAVAVKNNGKVLREDGDKVYLPFGSEYSILIKNLNSVRAQVKITIDDVDVLNGSSLVVSPNGSLEIERFLKDLDKGNKFKFIERTKSIEAHRGVGISDGLIRVEFQFERVFAAPSKINNWPPYRPSFDSNPWYGSGWYTTTSYLSNNVEPQIMNQSKVLRSTQAFATNSVNDVGITVPGSESNQKFVTSSWFPVESETHVIVLNLLGETENNRVEAPVTVKVKPKCVTCGRQNKATSKFCTNCGTSLNII